MIIKQFKQVGILINSSSPVFNGVSQEEFNFTSNEGTLDGFPPISTNFIEYAVSVPQGITVTFIRKLSVNANSQTIEIEQEMSYKTDTYQPVIIDQSTSGLALNNIAFTGSIIFRASQQLQNNEQIKIILTWQ